MAKLISKTYGDALFDVALEDGTMDALTEEVQTLSKVFKENEELSRFISHPKVSKTDKIQMIEHVFKGRFSDTLVGFLVLIIDKGRYQEIFSIMEYYMDRVREHKKIGVVWVTSALTLSKKQQEKIKQSLLATTQYNKLQIQYTVDKTILGGLIIRIKDRVVDNSIRSQIKAMTKAVI